MPHYHDEKELARKCGLTIEGDKLSPINRSKPPAPRSESETILCPECGKPLHCGSCEKPISAKSHKKWAEKLGALAGLVPPSDSGSDTRNPLRGPIRPKRVATTQQAEIVLSAVVGNNKEMMLGVESLYFEEGMSIADVTFAKGVMWGMIDLAKYKFYASDLMPRIKYGKHHGIEIAEHDCRALPYESGSMDVEVFDPPYSRNKFCEDEYLSAMFNYSPKEVAALYRDGMAEAVRVVAAGGLIMVKCQDEKIGGEQRRNSIEIWRYATQELGLIDVDQFSIVNLSAIKGIGGKMRGKQKNTVKNISFLWVFRKQK